MPRLFIIPAFLDDFKVLSTLDVATLATIRGSSKGLAN